MPEKMPEPPKLFRVQRFAPLRHRIFWERQILFNFGLINNVSGNQKHSIEFCFKRKNK